MKKLMAFVLFVYHFSALAHPVIYQGGWAISSSNMADISNNYVTYSVSNRLAAGIEHWRFTENGANDELGLLKLNHLLGRLNGESYQANIYLTGGVGVLDREINKRETSGTYATGIEADWESRFLYTSLKHYQFQYTSVSQGRIGFSPKEAPFESLQTWLMLQAMVVQDVQESVVLTPLVRFFYQNVLWEMGSSTRGDWMLNLMVHY